MKILKKPNLNYLKQCFISVDPGSEGTGIAGFYETEIPTFAKILENRGKSWEEKCDYICMQFKYELDCRKNWLRCVYCEQPQYMQTFTGITSASSGSLFKLCTLYGRIWQVTVSCGIKFFPVEIPKWKGQLDKQKVKIRVNRIIPNNTFKSHEIDAVGIGLYVKGIF